MPVVAVQSLSRFRLLATPWLAACQAPLSSTISWSLLKFMSMFKCLHPYLPFLVFLISTQIPRFPSTIIFLHVERYSLAFFQYRSIGEISQLSSVSKGTYFTFILFFFHFPFKFFIKVQLIYNVVPISAVQQSDSVIHLYTFFFIFFSIMIYHRILSIVLCAPQ